MKAFYKPLLLLLATFAIASCGGGGGGSKSVFSPPGNDSISISASPSGSIGTNSFTALTVVVKKNDGSAEDDGTTVTATLSPANIGTVTATQGTSGGSSATNTLSGGKTSFYFNSTNVGGTASISFSLPAGLHGNPNSATSSFNVTVVPGNTQDPRLQLTAQTTTLPLNPFNPEVYPFPGNYPGSPYISEVTVTWRHSNGQLVTGTTKVNASIDPTLVAGFSELDDPTTLQSDPTKPDGNEFLTIIGSGPVNVTGGNGVIFVHSFDHPGTAVLTVTAIDPDSGQTISSQLTFTVAGASSALPSSINAFSEGAAYVTGSGGPQSAIVNATVTDGNNANVADPANVDNVEFTIVGPAGNDARLSGINAAGTPVTGTTVDTQTHNGVATVTVLSGTVEGPVQIRATADRADNNVDNGIQDGVSSTATVTISDGKLYSLTIVAPDADSVNATGVSPNVVENPTGSGNYQLTISATGNDSRGNPVIPNTQIGFGTVDTPETPNSSGNLVSWFQVSGKDGDPQEGGTLFTSVSGHFTSSSVGPGDTLLVIGKQSEGAPAGNDDLESAVKISSINSATSLNVVTPFNLNDRTGVIVDNHGVLPYLIGHSQFTNINSPAYTDGSDSVGGAVTGVASTTLNYPVSAIGRAVAIWAQGTGTDTTTSPGHTDVVTDVQIIMLPGIATGATLTASPDPILGNSDTVETVCYYDGGGHPIANYDISFAFNFGGVGSGSADGVSNSGKFKQLTGANGCVNVHVITASLAASGTGTPPTITFSAGPLNTGGSSGGAATSVTVPFVVNAAQLQASCPANSTSGTFVVSLKLQDGAGNPLPGQTITGQCTTSSGTGSLTVGPILPTDATGSTTATVTVPAGVTGKCIFSPTNFPTIIASATVGATNACSGGFSPQP